MIIRSTNRRARGPYVYSFQYRKQRQKDLDAARCLFYEVEREFRKNYRNGLV